MKWIFLSTALCISFAVFAQGEATFYVSKSKAGIAKNRTKVFDFNFFKGVDTIYGAVCDNYAAIGGQYDSVSVFNGAYQIFKRGDEAVFCVTLTLSTKQNYRIILKLFKKDEKGDFAMIYIHNFVLVNKLGEATYR